MAKRQSVTSVEIAPDQERRSRFIKYTVAMIIRVICIVLAVIVPLGWATLFFAIGAVFLPYFAVIIANEGSARDSNKAAKVEAPTLSIGADAFRKADDEGK
ncbi:MAG: DUF3099 domain-containing protein [Micrococcales bacterium]|nr:DUF3099 domain-containing protein [Micrococcales bacterium]